jgi:hypothetical protein
MHTEISPWIEKLSPYRLVIALGAAFLVLVVALAWVGWRWSVAESRMELMQQQAAAGFLQPPSSNRTVRVDLRSSSQVAVGGREFPERIDLLLNARTTRFARFRVSLLREDGTLLVHADQLVRDSNMDLRFSLNSSILPQGGYLLRVDGYARGGKLQRFGETRLRVADR